MIFYCIFYNTQNTIKVLETFANFFVHAYAYATSPSPSQPQAQPPKPQKHPRNTPILSEFSTTCTPVIPLKIAQNRTIFKKSLKKVLTLYFHYDKIIGRWGESNRREAQAQTLPTHIISQFKGEAVQVGKRAWGVVSPTTKTTTPNHERKPHGER